MAKKKKKVVVIVDERSPYAVLAEAIMTLDMPKHMHPKRSKRVQPGQRIAYKAGVYDVDRLIYLGLTPFFVRHLGEQIGLCRKNKHASEPLGLYCEGWNDELDDREVGTAAIEVVKDFTARTLVEPCKKRRGSHGHETNGSAHRVGTQG